MVFIFGTSALASSPGSEGVQQSVTVKGTVVDSNNDPLVGVSVLWSVLLPVLSPT